MVRLRGKSRPHASAGRSRIARVGACTIALLGLVASLGSGPTATATAEDTGNAGATVSTAGPGTATPEEQHASPQTVDQDRSTPQASSQSTADDAGPAAESSQAGAADGDAGAAVFAQEAPRKTRAGTLPAVFATGGSGRFKESIQWLQWGDYADFAGVARPNVPVLDYGEEKTFTNFRNMGEAGRLITTCTLSGLEHLGHAPDVTEGQAKAPLVATIPGAWAGDALDNLYNIGGPASWSDGGAEWHDPLAYPRDYTNHNQMVIGLANGYAYNGGNTWDGKPWGTPGADTTPTGYAARVRFGLSCSARLEAPDGSARAVPLSGLVFADAEASSTRSATDEYQNEWVQATVQPGVTWRVLDTLRSADCRDTRGGTGRQITTDGVLSDGGRTLQLRPTGMECVYQNYGSYSKPNGLGGPDAVMFMEGATSATITLQGSGYSAVALGLIIATDFGDAPESYGKASSLFQPSWQGGTVGSTRDLFAVSPQAEFGQSNTRLGDYIDAEGYQLHSADAQGDDDGGTPDDEDGVALPADGIRTQPGATWTQQARCTGPGRVAGWIDWNHNGIFDPAEKSDEVACTTDSVQLTWTVPGDVVRSVDGEAGSQPDTFMRVRITDDPGALAPTGNTATGEVEDYKVAVRVPTLELVKRVDGTYASAEVPALDADRWSLTGQQGSQTDGHHLVTGQGSAGRNVVVAGVFALSETSADPSAAGYTASAWSCRQTEGTAAGGQAYSSTVSGSRVSVNNQDRVTCEITNSAKPGSLVWRKLDEDARTQVAGSQWLLTGPGVPGGTLVADCTQAPCPAGDYADQDPAAGAFELTGLVWGTYSIREAQAPTGYAAAGKVFTFPQLTGAALSARLADSSDPDGTVSDSGIVNKRLTGSVAWQKHDMHSNALSGSQWLLTGPDVPAGTTVADCVADTAGQCAGGAFADTDPRAGSFKVTGLSWSDKPYSLRESVAPAGYRLDATTHEFRITADALDYVFDTAFTNRPREGLTVPLTGGMGTDIVLLAGGMLMATALASGVAIRKRRARRP